MGEQSVEGQRFAQSRMELVRHGRDPRGTGRVRLDVGELLAL
jgi:hypothetical protein